MKAVDFLKLISEILKLMSDFELRRDDWKHIALYEEYMKMRGEGEKVDYILYYLSNKYHTSESSIKRIIKRLSKEFRT